MTITRSTFDQLTMDLVERTAGPDGATIRVELQGDELIVTHDIPDLPVPEPARPDSTESGVRQRRS